MTPSDPLPRIPTVVPASRYKLGLLWWRLALVLLAPAARAQPTNWTTYEQGDPRYYQGTDAQGRQ